MDIPSLCIDLGASFTKIAVRTGPNDNTILLHDQSLPVARGEEANQYCFPSVAAHNIKSKRWAFGWEASDYQESPEILILQDWKSVLFHRKYLHEYFDPSIDGEVDPVEIFLEKRDPYFIALGCAQNYLKWLYDEQIPHLLAQYPELKDYQIADFETRVCVPDFVTGTGAGETIDRLMEEAGFENSDSYLISEPRASLIGIITEGRNRLNADGAINQTAMFGDHKLLDQLKRAEDAIFFLDLGSFTTDMALANLSRFQNRHLSKAPAASYALGLYKLDSLILNSLPPHVRSQVNLNNLPQTEKFHRAIYHEDSLMKFASKEVISLSDDTEIPLASINHCLDQFADAIIDSCISFLNRHENGDIHAAILTGGASLPSRVSDRIVRGIERLDLPLLRAHQNIGTARVPVDPISQNLVRGASAIGGCSILYSAGEGWDEPTQTEELIDFFKSA